MDWTIYHHPRCRKSREALTLLEAAGIQPRIVLYQQDPPSKTELKAMLRQLGMKAEELLRREEALYKEEIRDRVLSEEECLDWMLRHPELIQRPLVSNGKKAVIGRPPERVHELMP
jgi:arsenate reductase (glutaredoxin)